ESSLAFKSIGVMRRWTLGNIDFQPDFFAPYIRVPHERAGDLDAVLELQWNNPVEIADSPTFPIELDPSFGWGRVAAHLVADPEALRRFQIPKPDLQEGVKPELTAPWIKFPGKRSWARLRLKDEDLYRLRVDDLIALGLPASEVKTSA